GQSIVQSGGGVVEFNRRRRGCEYRSGVEAFFHPHHLHSGDGVARHDGAMDGSRAAPPGKQRAVQIERAALGRIENGLRQNEPVCDDNREIEVERGERFLLRRLLQALRRMHFDTPRGGELVHWRGAFLLAAARRTWRLRIHTRNVVPCINQRFQRRKRESRRAHESDAQRHGVRMPTFTFVVILDARSAIRDRGDSSTVHLPLGPGFTLREPRDDGTWRGRFRFSYVSTNACPVTPNEVTAPWRL